MKADPETGRQGDKEKGGAPVHTAYPLRPSIACPECGAGRSRQLDVRPRPRQRAIRRRYECERGHRFITFEREGKTNGSRRVFADPPYVPAYEI